MNLGGSLLIRGKEIISAYYPGVVFSGSQGNLSTCIILSRESESRTIWKLEPANKVSGKCKLNLS